MPLKYWETSINLWYWNYRVSLLNFKNFKMRFGGSGKKISENFCNANLSNCKKNKNFQLKWIYCILSASSKGGRKTMPSSASQWVLFEDIVATIIDRQTKQQIWCGLGRCYIQKRFWSFQFFIPNQFFLIYPHNPTFSSFFVCGGSSCTGAAS